MPRLLTRCLPALIAASVLTAAQFAPSPYDWPQWRGPERDGVSRETGLLQEWPRQGPPLAWEAKDLGGGYSAPTVAAGRVFGMSYREDDEVVWALDAATGRELWCTRIAGANRLVPASDGPRCSPTVAGDLLFVLGVSGDLVCLETACGEMRWHRNLLEDFDGRIPDFGFCESPLVDGDRVVVTPGGVSAGLAALDRRTGQTVWTSRTPGGDRATYSSVVTADVDGLRQYVQFLGGGVVGVAAADGKFLWRYDRPANPKAICSTPVVRGPYVFASSSYNRGGGLVRLSREEGGVRVDEDYFSKRLKNQHGGIVLVDGYLYGCSDPGSLVCMEFRTGKVKWEDRRAGKGSLAYADHRLYYHDQTGPVVLIEANPEHYAERGRFNPPGRSDKEAWSHPVVADGRLYVRDQGVLLAYDVRRPEAR